VYARRLSQSWSIDSLTKNKQSLGGVGWGGGEGPTASHPMRISAAQSNLKSTNFRSYIGWGPYPTLRGLKLLEWENPFSPPSSLYSRVYDTVD
jgi:hypothetical protein